MTRLIIIHNKMLQFRASRHQTAQVNRLHNLATLHTDANDFRWASTNRLLQSVDDADIEHPQHIIWIEINVNSRLQ